MKLVLIGFIATLTFDGGSTKADFVFGEPVNLGQIINGSDDIFGSSISSDGLELYFASNRTGGYGGYDLWVSSRETLNVQWSEPVNLGPVVNSNYDAFEPCISADSLTLYFSDTHPPENNNRIPGGLNNDGNIWKVTRATLQDPWKAPVNIGPGVNSAHAIWPGVSADGLALYFNSHRSGSKGGHCDLMVAGWNSTTEQFENPVFLSDISSSSGDFTPEISDDGLALFFCSNRSGGYGDSDLWMTTRSSISDTWSAPVNLGPTINKSSGEGMPDISSDGSILYFSSSRLGGFGRRDLWQAPIITVVDFNADGIVDTVDMCIMIDHWGTDDTLCDIGPMPWGDGVVDVQDLIILAEHLFEGAGLVAHWALDEITGDVAYDSVGNIDATVYNGQWAEGRIDGALDFNGLTTYMDYGDSLRLSTRQMTLAMWLEPQHMGGMRYILSRVKERSEDFDYVLMRHRYGEIEFAVAQEGSEPVSVLSSGITPLNEWTHVAVCLDGSEATIYINGQLDASAGYGQRSSCEDCRLWISSLGKDTRYYNGKIDDIRVYNIALSPEEIAVLAQ